MSFPLRKFFVLFSLGLGVQLAAFNFIGPLSYPDTIRYFNFADFLYNPRVAHFGDLAYSKGILFTSLFLPSFLFSLRKLIGLPYSISGIILQFISFQLILWLSYAIALKIDGRKTACITIILLLTYPIFCLRSILILTEYPFTAVFLLLIFYLFNHGALNLKQAFIISFLSMLLVSIRLQGILFVVIILLYLLYSNKAGLGKVLLICFSSLAYVSFYIYFYFYLNKRFPLTLALNESFSLNSFFSGESFADYNYYIHGVGSLSDGQISLKSFPLNLKIYMDLIIERFSAIIQFLNSGPRYYYIFIAVILFAFIFSKVKKKALLISLIILNLIMVILLLIPHNVFIRYQTVLFPLVIIFISSCFVNGYKNRILRTNFGRFILFSFALFYLCYFVMRHHDFFQKAEIGKYVQSIAPKQIATESAQLIRDNIGIGQGILASDTSQYNIIYLSGNTPLYFFDGWSVEQISDYLQARNVRHLIGNYKVVYRLRSKGIGMRMISPLLETLRAEEQLYLWDVE